MFLDGKQSKITRTIGDQWKITMNEKGFDYVTLHLSAKVSLFQVYLLGGEQRVLLIYYFCLNYVMHLVNKHLSAASISEDNDSEGVTSNPSWLVY